MNPILLDIIQFAEIPVSFNLHPIAERIWSKIAIGIILLSGELDYLIEMKFANNKLT